MDCGRDGAMLDLGACDRCPRAWRLPNHRRRRRWGGRHEIQPHLQRRLRHQRIGATAEQQLQASLMAFADRFMSRVEEATNAIQSRTTDPHVRQQAQTAKYYPSLGVVTIAADTDPSAALLDMVAMVTLQNDVWKTWAPQTFGLELAKPLLEAGRDMEGDIWSVAAKVLTDEQQQSLRDLIATWRSEHPNETYVAMVRFDDFMLLRGGDSQRRSRSLLEFNIVTGVYETARQMRQARIFGERAMFLAARMPLLIAWQTELVAYGFALTPEVRQTLDNAAEFTASVKQLSDDINRLPQRVKEQTESTLKLIDERQEKLDALVTSVRAGMTEAEDLAAKTRDTAEALNQLVRSTDALVTRLQPARRCQSASRRPAVRHSRIHAGDQGTVGDGERLDGDGGPDRRDAELAGVREGPDRGR